MPGHEAGGALLASTTDKEAPAKALGSPPRSPHEQKGQQNAVRCPLRSRSERNMGTFLD
ncbi:MAG TPA: hypothetical protein VHK63_05965 [Candidatus Limnocylindria bacterium]|nr:hypothetical protein [Candidatus Limnocylindria bacterium]